MANAKSATTMTNVPADSGVISDPLDWPVFVAVEVGHSKNLISKPGSTKLQTSLLSGYIPEALKQDQQIGKREAVYDVIFSAWQLNMIVAGREVIVGNIYALYSILIGKTL